MSSIGTFGSFTTARLGIYAAQHGLSITGNNISNINTPGYTRQRLDQISLSASVNDRYASDFDLRIGYGALCTGISQIRDPFLDIRYRNELSSMQSMDTKLSGLNDLAGILDEIFDGDEQKNGVIEAQFMDFVKKLESLAANAGQKEYDSQLQSSAKALVTLFNSYAKKLDDVNANTINQFKQDMEKVNNILENIGKLNSSIRKSEIHGDNALEMRDERNRLIDELSKHVKIDVTYEQEPIGAGQTVEKLVIKLGNANPDPKVTTDSTVLVDGSYIREFGVTQVPKPNPAFDPKKPAAGQNLPYLDQNDRPTDVEADAAKVDSPNFDITLGELTDHKGNVLQGSTDVKLDDNDLYGSLQSIRELLTESGEFASQDTINNMDENAGTKRGIPYYQKSLDLLANKFAQVFNEANTDFEVNKDGNYVDATGQEIQSAAGAPIPSKPRPDEATMKHIEQNGGVKKGGPLFSSRGDNNDIDGITAGNISISADWANGTTKVVNSFVQGAGSTANDNLTHIVSLMGNKFAFDPTKVDADANSQLLFEGSFQEMLGNISSVLGNDQRSTNIQLRTFYASAVELDTSRMSVSSVDLNDEAANLMQYQQSYSAACRVMTTLDETLDKLINGTGMVGR